jgi:hypothetical protein
MLGLFLLYQRSLGEASPWAPYLATLPTSFQSLTSWSREERRDLLVGFPRAAQVEKDVAEIEATGAALVARGLPFLTDVADWRWAASILNTRSIWWAPEGRHLVPMLDMVNCAPGMRPHSTRLSPDGGFADTRAPRAFATGDEVVENYAQPNWVYLFYHGFVLEDNEWDCVEVTLQLPTEVREDESRRTAVLASLRSSLGASGARDEATFCLAPSTLSDRRTPPSDEATLGLPRALLYASVAAPDAAGTDGPLTLSGIRTVRSAVTSTLAALSVPLPLIPPPSSTPPSSTAPPPLYSPTRHALASTFRADTLSLLQQLIVELDDYEELMGEVARDEL